MNTTELLKLFSTNDFLSEVEKKLLNCIYFTHNCKATAPQLAKMMGYSHFMPINGIVGKLGKKIANALNIPLRQRDDGSFAGWDVIFKGEYLTNGFQWTLKDEIISVLDKMDWIYYDKIAEEETETTEYDLKEGAVKQIFINSYERNPIARKICIENHGYCCTVCGFDFEKIYGEIGKQFIHVHHLIEISKRGKEYKVDPTKDLLPVCPNCHAMLHMKTPPLSVIQLKEMMNAHSIWV